ncbi:citrate/2-methylcitrate synthase [Lachnoclostridium sp. An181]|uniref:citrate/2-methylcitrate synthase n=1 Tax=Lachnoclostridium sp. An181 TaxID=1965575 RepID=UPI000B39A3B4|nr:citrate/2-methylcitrate synthase [Lachnoclostridium sp. An181]OUP49221.1 citrate synthase [Lachnoclostridium sp. An181]
MAENVTMNLLENTPKIQEFAALCEKNNAIERELYTKYEVKRGLRDLNGKGVLAGLTNISDVCAKKIVNGEEVPCEGNLYYRGYNIKDLVRGFLEANHFGFEEIAYLILFGDLPNEKQLAEFHDTLVERRMLPPNFVRDVIMKAPSSDMMNSLSRSMLSMYSYDRNPDDTSIPNVLRQCLNLISQFPMMMVYGYHAYNYHGGDDLYIYRPYPELSTAENILMMLREDRQYSELEAKILDMALVLHMDHGGGNNSTFTTHVVTSSGTDTYSTMVAAMASLKGPKHGGANIKVTGMFEDMEKQVKDWEDKDEVRRYLEDLLDKKAFDKKGLIYGMGHAVYSISDPRADIFKAFVKQLAQEKGREKEYALYEMVEQLAPEVIAERRRMYKGVNANVDFYSGLVYSMLGIPKQLYTPIFAAARIVGWSAHRLEELINVDKIIRPAYKPLAEHREYVKMEER